MSSPVIFLSAATLDLNDWRDTLHAAFSRAGFHVLTQNHSLEAAAGGVRRLIVDTIAKADCVIHLAGMAYGSDATDPFPDSSSFKCSWTQFEYYHAHATGKDVIAFVCAPSLSKPFVEKGTTEAERNLNQALQEAHRNRVQSGSFEGTPLEGTSRASPEMVSSQEELLKAVAAAIGALKRFDSAHEKRIEASFEKVIGQQHHSKRLILLTLGIPLLCLAIGLPLTFAYFKGKADEITDQARDNAEEVQKAFEDPIVLKGRLEAEIKRKAEELIAPLEGKADKWREIVEIEKQRDLALDRLDNLLDSIGRDLKEDSHPVFRRAAQILNEKGLEEAAEYLDLNADTLLEEAEKLKEQQDELEKQKRKTLKPVGLQSSLLEMNFQWDRALELRKRVASLASEWWEARNGLAGLYLSMAEWEPAEEEFTAALRLTTDPTELSLTRNMLASLLIDTGRLPAAEKLLREELQLIESADQSGSPSHVSTVLQLATVFSRTNQFSESEKLYHEAITTLEENLGKDHPNTATALTSLSALHFRMGQLQKAEDVQRKAISIQETRLRHSDPSFVAALGNLAQILRASGRAEEAISVQVRLVSEIEQRYGPKHPNLSHQLSNLGGTYVEIGDLDGAEKAFRRALEIDLASFGRHNLTVAARYYNLAGLLSKKGDFEESEKCCHLAVEIHARTVTDDKPECADIFSLLSYLAVARKELNEAVDFAKRALVIRRAHFGNDAMQVATDLNNLASPLTDLRQFEEAEPHYKDAIRIHELHSETNTAAFATLLCNYSNLLYWTRRFDESAEHLSTALAIDEKLGDSNQVAILRDLKNLATSLTRTKNFVEAEKMFKRALELEKQLGGAENPQVVQIRINRAYALQMSGKLPEAKEEIHLAALTALRRAMKYDVREKILNLAILDYREILGASGLDPDQIKGQLTDLGAQAGWNDAEWTSTLGAILEPQ